MSELTTSAAPVSATVVVSQKVVPGREKEFLAWQGEINKRCSEFPGFESAEVVAPVPPFQEDFVILFRFDTAAHLDAWMRSDVRKTLLAQGAPLFASDARQHTVARARSGSHGAGIVITTRVKAGKEKEFREWEDRINAAASRFPGFEGVEVFPPVAGVQDEWIVVVRFDSPEHLEQWRVSDVRRRMVDEASRLWEESTIEKINSGFPGWFASDTALRGGALPPDWKQAMLVLLVLYPVVMAQTYLLSPPLAWLRLPEAMFIQKVVSMVILTYALMPIAIRTFDFWLHPDPARRTRVEVLGIGAHLIGYAVAVAFFLLVDR